MTDAPVRLTPQWKDRLGLTHRRSPELYETSEAVVDVPHAPAIRAALDEMGLSAIFCVQGVPTVAIYQAEVIDADRLMGLYGALWNQGLASLLLVISDDSLRAYSLARKPLHESVEAFEKRCLIEVLTSTAEALAFRNLIHGAESGRLWRDHAEHFRLKERIDQVLLDNLVASHNLLQRQGMSSDAAQALLIQTMFVAYLEDREIVTPNYFAGVSDGRCQSFSDLLVTGETRLLQALFKTLRSDFNGDLFVAPSSFEPNAQVATLSADHLAILDRFRTGREEMAKGGQQRFWGYDFRYIPIELVSAVYDRFLGEQEEERRAKGAFYTPMFLADTVVAQAWETLSERTRSTGRILDPACGSGVFLVRSFQRLCEHWRGTHRSRKIPWKTLLTLLGRTHGWDINGGAVRVAVFSLYVALLEEVSPRDIRELIKVGKLLPELWGKTLLHRDFFAETDKDARFELIIGNPPWTSRRGNDRASVRWSKTQGKPMPGGEDAWAFSWKALDHLVDGGLIAFLLPAMGFLHNHAAATVAARTAFFCGSIVHRVINFADLRFQLFEHAQRPTALILYSRPQEGGFPYIFDYWAPKADLNLRIKRVLTLSRVDRTRIPVAAVLDNPLVFKQRLWMREPDIKLFSYLTRMPKLGDLVTAYGGLQRTRQDGAGRWVIGQGYQPFTGDDADTDEAQVDATRPILSTLVGKMPDLPIGRFTRLYQSNHNLIPAPSPQVRRRGFEAGFQNNRILVPRGVETSLNRLRAAFCRDALTFEDILQAITVPSGEERRAKLITALLNSRVAVWYAFHGTASFGSDRPEVKQAELLRLPFPDVKDLPDPKASAQAADQLVAIIDEAEANCRQPFELRAENVDLLGRVDELAYAYFGLSGTEIALIEDTVEAILPALQPHESQSPRLWSAPGQSQRAAYAEILVESLEDWFQHTGISATLVATSADFGILRLRLGSAEPYHEDTSSEFGAVVDQLGQHIHQPLDGNFQLAPDLRVFVGESLFLIKPLQLRFWLRSTALADADAIALDLQQLQAASRKRSLP